MTGMPLADWSPPPRDWHEVGEDGMPVHLRSPLTIDGNGPAEGDDFHHWGCWCPDPHCPGPPDGR